MKKLISKFSEKLLSKQQLKTVKGGTPYCFCLGSPVNCPIGFPPGSQLDCRYAGCPSPGC